jgi:hypothetical protein
MFWLFIIHFTRFNFGFARFAAALAPRLGEARMAPADFFDTPSLRAIFD